MAAIVLSVYSVLMLKCILRLDNIFSICLFAAVVTKTNCFKDPRIVNGIDAKFSESRHQVSIRLRSLENEHYFGYGHICGGSLISKNVVLSAAHCFVNSYTNTLFPEVSFIAVMGTLDRLSYNKNTLSLNIMKVIIPEHFEFATLNNDIALVILTGEVPSQHPTVKEITLNEGFIKNNTLCQVTGWGYGYIPKMSRKLKVANQPFINTDDCREKSVYGFLVLDGMLCAGFLDDETQINLGDSGGPLVCSGVQVGIVSFRSSENIGPGIYTDVAYYKNWIFKELAKYDVDLPKFSFVPDM